MDGYSLPDVHLARDQLAFNRIYSKLTLLPTLPRVQGPAHRDMTVRCLAATPQIHRSPAGMLSESDLMPARCTPRISSRAAQPLAGSLANLADLTPYSPCVAWNHQEPVSWHGPEAVVHEDLILMLEGPIGRQDVPL